MGTVIRPPEFSRPIQLRRPQHTGEHVYCEPLAEFLRRKWWTRPDTEIPASPIRQGWHA